MALLCCTRLAVDYVQFGRWVAWLSSRRGEALPAEIAGEQARRHAAVIEQSAKRLPFRAQCLPQAVALSWLLRGDGIDHSLVIAARPPKLRIGPDALHAWVEVDGHIIIGDLAGPWIELLRLKGEPRTRHA